MENNCIKEKYIATLVGCALGDALGMPVEGWKKEQIKKYVGRITEILDPIVVRDSQGNRIEKDEYGKLKCYCEGLEKGEGTDDTILTFAIAESIAEKKSLDLEDIAAKHVKAYKERLKPDGRLIGGFGGTTIAGIKNLIYGIHPSNSGVIGGPGNAPGMKMHTIGMYAHATESIETTLDFAKAVGKMTHLDSRSIATGIIQANCIFHLLAGISRQEFIENIVEVCAIYEPPLNKQFAMYEKGTLLERINWIKENKDTDPEEAYKTIHCSSIAFESYPFALFMFQKYWDNSTGGMIETVNYGGDCDTTGAIYGALCGAKNGMIFPKSWIHDSREIEKATKLGEAIYNLRQNNK